MRAICINVSKGKITTDSRNICFFLECLHRIRLFVITVEYQMYIIIESFCLFVAMTKTLA